ncbi:MAG: M48 family metallopeptidase [Spirochaetes bacterium]|nr:M48 family metallopeptidase [Spirochaetota bacterium]
MDLTNFIAISFFIVLILSIFFKLILDFFNYQYREKNQAFIPEPLKEHINQDKLIKINQYTNDKLKLELILFFVSNIFLLIILFLKIIPLFYQWLDNFFDNTYLIGLIFFGTWSFFNLIIGIPFDLYQQFVLEKKYDFNQMTLKLWFADLFKKLILGVILGIILLLPLLLFLYHFTNWWWLLLWGFLMVFSFIMQIIYPSFIAPLFNKFNPLSNEELRTKIEKLLENTGFHSKGVFEMDASKRSTHSNAYFSGFGKSKRIVLFDTMIEQLNEGEIISVLAHELGHFKLKHIRNRLLLSAAFSLIIFYILHLLIDLPYFYQAFHLSQPVRFIGIFLFQIFLSPFGFFLSPISSYFSRRNEFQADEYSIQFSQDKKSFSNALIKLNIDNLSNLNPHPIYAWFYYSHPPLLNRLKHIEEI